MSDEERGHVFWFFTVYKFLLTKSLVFQKEQLKFWSKSEVTSKKSCVVFILGNKHTRNVINYLTDSFSQITNMRNRILAKFIETANF